MSGPGARHARDRRLGSVLVGAQFVLIAWLAWRAVPAFLTGSAGAGAWLAMLASCGLAAWAVSANRPGNFGIHPAPRAGGRLVEHGPYRWIRHPMYSALLLGGVATALACGRVDAWLATLLLVGVLGAKARLEERWMTEVHPAYAAYQARTGRFLPRP